MAKGAFPGAVVIGWLISGVGMLALAFVYQRLSMQKPTLDAGPNAYARVGFGDFIGFNSAWGYWLSAWIGSVSHAVLMSCALSYFAPAFGAEGNAWQAIVGAFICLWIVHALILLGIRQADLVNVIGTIAKLAPIFIFIVAVLIAFNIPAFNLHFWGAGARRCHGASQERDTCDLVGFLSLLRAPALFPSAQKNRAGIGTATILGFAIALAAFFAIPAIKCLAFQPTCWAQYYRVKPTAPSTGARRCEACASRRPIKPSSPSSR
jgi:arginine:ornithine antiporter/lysine permease